MGEDAVKVLAFDCSTARGGLAVVQNGTTIFAETFECPRGRGGAFFEVLDRAIKATGKPDRIAAGIGPGSYNGLRTAIAAAEGLRLATGAELVGIASVRALPCEMPEFVAVNDARGGVFYYVIIRNREIDGDFELLDAEAFLARLATQPGLPVLASGLLTAVPGARIVFPDAVVMAMLAQHEEPADGMLEPIYLKPAHITKPRAR
jgi:tRNA threonylcarbamoyladenosine biosynthesis protein TsaB